MLPTIGVYSSGIPNVCRVLILVCSTLSSGDKNKSLAKTVKPECSTLLILIESELVEISTLALSVSEMTSLSDPLI